MNAPIAQEHLTTELHEAPGRVTLDDDRTRSGRSQRRLTRAARELRRSYKYTAGAAGGFGVGRGGGMNAPIAQEHLTPELHEALGRVTLDDDRTRSGRSQRRLTRAARELRRSYKYTAGAAGGFGVGRGAA